MRIPATTGSCGPKTLPSRSSILCAQTSVASRAWSRCGPQSRPRSDAAEELMLDAIAHYKVLGPLGTGGLGEVYRARDTRVGRTVAVKVVPAAITKDPDRAAALLDATSLAARISHPNITALFEVGEDAGRQFLVFEFVPGDPL